MKYFMLFVGAIMFAALMLMYGWLWWIVGSIYGPISTMVWSLPLLFVSALLMGFGAVLVSLSKLSEQQKALREELANVLRG